MAIVGLDFGNYNSFPCVIMDFEQGTRIGGNVYDLLPGGLSEGIPSVFFYSDRIGVLCGESAVRDIAQPEANRRRFLKRNLGNKFYIGDKPISYDYAITQVIQYCVRRANEILNSNWQITTNQISLSYPATFTYAQKQRLVELAENATLSDGTPLRVVGTIKEPAAAALDYLSEFAKKTTDTRVMVYDLGGGTFDLALVAAYPSGRIDAQGKIYYYDILKTDGIAHLGGNEFDNIMYDIILKKYNTSLSPAQKRELRKMAERTKISLTNDKLAAAALLNDGDYLEAIVTREEFEKESRPLLMKTIDMTKNFLQNNTQGKPDIILLTGGASQMPMVKEQLEAAIPMYRNKIVSYRPSRAIAYGAARFGTVESNRSGIIQQHIDYDIGVRFFDSTNDKKGHIKTYLKAGTPIPCTSASVMSHTIFDKQRYSTFRVFEAKTNMPNPKEVDRDYTEIMYVTIDHEKEVPKGTKNETKMEVNQRGLLTIEAIDTTKPKKPTMKKTVELKNLR